MNDTKPPAEDAGLPTPPSPGRVPPPRIPPEPAPETPPAAPGDADGEGSG